MLTQLINEIQCNVKSDTEIKDALNKSNSFQSCLNDIYRKDGSGIYTGWLKSYC